MKNKTASTKKDQYMRHVGNCWLAGKDVIAYKVSDKIMLVAETSGGKRMSAPKFVSESEFDGLMDEWTKDGALHRGDARITEAALECMKANA